MRKNRENPCTAAITSTAGSRVPFSVAQLERPLSPAITESGAIPLSQPSLHDHKQENIMKRNASMRDTVGRDNDQPKF